MEVRWSVIVDRSEFFFDFFEIVFGGDVGGLDFGAAVVLLEV